MAVNERESRADGGPMTGRDGLRHNVVAHPVMAMCQCAADGCAGLSRALDRTARRLDRWVEAIVDGLSWPAA